MFGGSFATPPSPLVAIVVLVALLLGGVAVRGWAQLQRQRVTSYWPQELASRPLAFWTTPDANVRLGQITGPDESPALDARTVGPRSLFTILEHTFPSAEDWSDRRDLFVSLRGQGTGALFQLVMYTNENHTDWISFDFRDLQSGWRVLTLDLRAPDDTVGRPDLGHVTELRLGSSDRSVPGRLAIGSVAVSQSGAG